MAQSVHDFEVKKIDGESISLKSYSGKTLLIVNVASKCGLTPQYEGLERLYERYKEQGLEILGFPANEFLGQEPGSNDEIQEFCRANFGVQFPMFQKIVVKGQGQHPLYDYLTHQQPTRTKNPDSQFEAKLQSKGLLSGGDEEISWNFEKFLVDSKGHVVQRFAPDVLPQDQVVIQALEKQLGS